MSHFKNSLREKLTTRGIKFTLALLVIGALFCLAVGTINGLRPNSASKTRAVAASAPAVTAARRSGNKTVRRAELMPQLRDAFGILGDRLHVSGKERLVLYGVLNRSDDSTARPFLLIQELPGSVRFQEQAGTVPLVAIFDGARAWKPGGQLNRVEENILETMAYDSAERLFIAHAAGAATRYLGSRFRVGEGEGDAKNVFDVYQLTDQVQTAGKVQSQTKSFYLNSDALLLDRIRYQLERDGNKSEVEVRFEDWRQVQGQKVAFRISRIETGTPTITLTINSASVGPLMNDGIFTKP